MDRSLAGYLLRPVLFPSLRMRMECWKKKRKENEFKKREMLEEWEEETEIEGEAKGVGRERQEGRKGARGWGTKREG